MPVQTNGLDCGVFMLQFTFDICFGREFAFTQVSIWRCLGRR